MKLDYIPLASVPTAESLSSSAKVLVVDGGEIKKTAKANVGEHPSGKITITENATDIDVSSYATADVAVEGGGSSGIPTPELTMTIVCSDYADITQLEPNFVDNTNNEYKAYLLTELTSEQTVITGLVLPYVDWDDPDLSLTWSVLPAAYFGDDVVMGIASNPVNCTIIEGGFTVTDPTAPVSCTMTFTKSS